MRDVFAIYDNIIWPRLIMIIIKTKYYPIFHTKHTHTDDFPSKGTRLVLIMYKMATQGIDSPDEEYTETWSYECCVNIKI